MQQILILEENPNILNEDKYKSAQSQWYHASQCSYDMAQFDQLASNLNILLGKSVPAEPGLTSTSPARSNNMVAISTRVAINTFGVVTS